MKSNNSTTITFANEAQLVIFRDEILGQLSDGAWENTTPYEHWKFWHDLELKVGSKIGISGYVPGMQKRSYNLTCLTKNDTHSFDAVPRMRAFVVANKLGFIDVPKGAVKYLIEEGSYEKFVLTMNRNAIGGNSEFWDKYRYSITESMACQIFKEYPNYTRADCIKDIKGIKEAMKTNADDPKDEHFEEFTKDNKYNSYEIEVGGVKKITCGKPTQIKRQYPTATFTGWRGPFKPALKLSGQNGNVFNLIGLARTALRNVGMIKEAEEMTEKITSLKNYDAAIQTIMQYCDVH